MPPARERIIVGRTSLDVIVTRFLEPLPFVFPATSGSGHNPKKPNENSEKRPLLRGATGNPEWFNYLS